MYQHPYLHQAMKAEQCNDWQRAAARQRVIASIHRDRRADGQCTVGSLGSLLITMGTWLERKARRGESVA
jgi:hypothetical protein